MHSSRYEQSNKNEWIINIWKNFYRCYWCQSDISPVSPPLDQNVKQCSSFEAVPHKNSNK